MSPPSLFSCAILDSVNGVKQMEDWRFAVAARQSHITLIVNDSIGSMVIAKSVQNEQSACKICGSCGWLLARIPKSGGGKSLQMNGTNRIDCGKKDFAYGMSNKTTDKE